MFKRLLYLAKRQTEKFLSLILTFLVLILLVSSVRGLLRLRQSNLSIKDAGESVGNLEKESERLKKDLEAVKSEAYVEKQIREKLGLAKEGEVVIVLPDEDTLRKLAPDYTEEEETLPDPNWRRWLKLFDF
ncbi:hypothetical protein A2686_01470 [Candidatus Woesebacteria bacterium RIFCSPHIGHO2_01_FULL_38_10]|uniref:Cell division protein FtsL n=1 Tax=Candidatus Woesebacteria bacterium RIFCSPLOWO2_01_FULL_39_10b TaxID=1802517 RepID=A0A1F8B9E4_9BACT|nr:MAG: hypothetical protein A2686_01470 [Candidatus Woesebacteria bacterium RIFCSPHIGHO2_01_FULL_38_10]OGM59968.1 MAG: hypothetical protein A2892_03650 [Candidatus Woesebacteria bacterium RIFCSPLOWO2_01_FULL_39_10b]